MTHNTSPAEESALTAEARPCSPLVGQDAEGLWSRVLGQPELQWLLTTAQQLQTSETLEALLDIVVVAVRQHFQVDRALVYRFQTHHQGVVVAESVTEGYKPSLWEMLPTIAFGAATPELARQQIVMIGDVAQTELSPYQQQLMFQQQTQASLSIPLLLGKVWGLLVLQHGRPKTWQDSELALSSQLVAELRLSLQQVEAQQQRRQRIQQHEIFTQLISKIYQVGDADSVDSIFQVTARDLRRQLQVDRVTIHRFSPQGRGSLIAESVAPEWEPMLSSSQTWLKALPELLALPDPHLRRAYTVEDVEQVEQLAFSDEGLAQLGARAYAIAPILRDKTPWGAIAVCQNDGPRHWSPEDTILLVQTAQVLDLALHQVNYRRKLQTQAERIVQISVRQRLMDQVVDRLQQCVELQQMFSMTCREIRYFLKSERTVIYRFDLESDYCSGQTMAEDVQPGCGSAISMARLDYGFSESAIQDYKRGRIWRLSHVQQAAVENGLIESLSHAGVKAALVMPLMKGNQLWGLFGNYQYSTPRDWKNDEIQFLERIAAQLNTAIQQGEHIEALQRQSTQLREAAEQERLIFQVVGRIRRSLDLQQALDTTAREIRHFLRVDRVAIFKFDADSHYSQGETIAEDVHPSYVSAMQVRVEDHCFSQGFADQYKRGRIWAIANIYEAGLQQCYLDVLAQFQVQANLVVPLLQGDDLWGLFCIHQCDRPRQWQAGEINFARRIAAQLDIAIQQGNSLEVLQRQTVQLAEAVDRDRSEKAQIQQQLVQLLSMVRLSED
ncbi:MAG: GAF domain-containing protein [Cyanobacteria bacterium P01_A01_bin.135]